MSTHRNMNDTNILVRILRLSKRGRKQGMCTVISYGVTYHTLYMHQYDPVLHGIGGGGYLGRLVATIDVDGEVKLDDRAEQDLTVYPLCKVAIRLLNQVQVQ